MDKTDTVYQLYKQIMETELVPSMGCTEPIALAYAASRARDMLGRIPEEVEVSASGNIIKNVKSVVVPNTGGQKGVEAAVAAGIIAGRTERGLELLSSVSDDERQRIMEYIEHSRVTVKRSESGLAFDILLNARWEDSRVSVRIANSHTNVVRLEKDGEVFLDLPVHPPGENTGLDYSALNVESIVTFADAVDISDVKSLLERQIVYNSAIADAGLTGDYGANIGKVLLHTYGEESVTNRAKARAAAGSDARMNGCSLPVVINSGSGNQGITASVPVIEYAKALGSSREELYRALIISNLTTIHLKTGIGRLSAYCGAVSAGAGAGAGIAYLYQGGTKEIAHTIVNALAIVSGIVCDGAKASCAAKIASAVDAGILGYSMYKDGQQFRGGDGIVKKGVEATISKVALLGRKGMKETDKEIIDIMLGE